ncbi:MAG: DUF302 domain-containing protein [Thermoanaerobaculia bacterium]|nr:DUF302 domain-containing protein [Thermoanaerobaculia bacterium]
MNVTMGMHRALDSTYDQALERVPEALKTEGFGVLTEIDVRRTLHEKLGADFRRYKILGACNPPFAHEALQIDLQAGLMMPCNVIVYEDDAGRAHLLAVDPSQTVASLGDPRLIELAAAVRDKLARAIALVA